MTKRSRRFRESGGLRQLPSGRWQASMLGIDGRRVSIGAYRTRTEAEHSLAAAMVERQKGQWVDPRSGKVTLKEYADQWMLDRTALRPRTREFYEGLLRLHILPSLGKRELAAITPTMVRHWHGALSRAEKPGAVTVAKAYRLFRTIMNTAVEEDVISKNPCNIKGAGVEQSPERPIATMEQVAQLADAIDPRYRAIVLIATYCTLRFGELFGLQRKNIDIVGRTVTVEQQVAHLATGELIIGPPKTNAGRRVVSIPASLVPEIAAHLDTFVDNDPEAWVFRGPSGIVPRKSNWSVLWRRTTASVGIDGLHFHDLRHTGNTLAASTGASTKELMSRMGHASSRAALIYQHATQEREDAIAAALDRMLVRNRRTVMAEPA